MANGHGGVREGAGRPRKSDEQKIIEMLSPYETKALKALENGLDKNEAWAVKLWMEYTHGKPKEQKTIEVKEKVLKIGYAEFEELEDGTED